MGARNVSQQIKSEELTEQSIQRRLNRFFASWKYNVDGLYVFEWESDKLIWTKAGYIYEFEIKISRADFKNDFKHKKDKHIILKGPTKEEQLMPSFYESYEWNKKNYTSIEDFKARLKPTDSYYIANHRKPNFFYYAVSEGMIQPDEVPEYAGLIYIKKEYMYESQSFAVVRKAPQLHKQKYKDAELNLGEKFYYNWQTERRRCREMERNFKDVRRQLDEELASKHQEKTYAAMERELAFAKEQEEHWKKSASQSMRDNMANRAENKRLRKVIRDMDLDFDFKPIEDEIDKLYGIIEKNKE
jgi:hypothetical protein